MQLCLYQQHSWDCSGRYGVKKRGLFSLGLFTWKEFYQLVGLVWIEGLFCFLFCSKWMDNDDGNTDNVDVIITITVISIITSLSYCKKLVFLGKVRSLIYIHVEHSVLETTVGHWTLSNEILKISGQFHIMIGHSEQTFQQHILSYLLPGVISQ